MFISYSFINDIIIRSIYTSFLFAYNLLVNKMDKLFDLAEKEMFLLHNPYVGTEHFFLAYLKEYGSDIITYDEFRNYIKTIIGSSYLQSEYILYTPILRYIKENINDVKSAVSYILSDYDCIAYNILINKKVSIDELLKEINNK